MLQKYRSEIIIYTKYTKLLHVHLYITYTMMPHRINFDTNLICLTRLSKCKIKNASD